MDSGGILQAGALGLLALVLGWFFRAFLQRFEALVQDVRGLRAQVLAQSLLQISESIDPEVARALVKKAAASNGEEGREL